VYLVFLIFLDVALVSVLIYGVYLMVSKTRAVRILAGLGAVAVMYLIAHYFDLRLTVAIALWIPVVLKPSAD
jgi:DNA integrity scanning protein DisA with diadenylate cyclase activity